MKNTFLRPFFVYVRARKPSNAKLTEFAKVNYMPLRYCRDPNKVDSINHEVID